MTRARVKEIIVALISRLPVCWWKPASAIVRAVWPGFKDA